MSRSIRTATGLTAVLITTMNVLSPTALAQTDPGKTERLNAQMQSAAAAAAGRKPPPPPAVPNPNCTLIVPKNALTAAGLATPFQLTATDPGQGACNESNSAQAAFVQGAIFDPATGAISIYNPVVVDKGDNPLVPPVVPTLPNGAIVALWFGFNGNNLLLKSTPGDDSMSDARCVNGLNGNIFGQYSYCNAPAFFTAANAAVASGKLQVPASGTAKDGKPCPTVRDFAVVDQDQSDNVTTVYLVSPRGHISQFSAKNQAAHPSSKPMGNASDNRLVDVFVQPALGCKPWVAPNLADPGAMVPALPLNELQARANQPAPVAMIPLGDPMVLNNGNTSISKTNLYRQGVNQPTVDSQHDADTGRYCRQLLRISPERMFANQKVFSAFASPDPGAANSLFTFLAQRFVAAYQLLSCQTLVDNLADPVSVTVDGNGVAVTATLNTAALTKAVQRIQGQQAEDDAADSVDRERRSSL
ncbi:MAG: hypothetical protein JWO52_3742 [Gammaproteobacteria bacterium]|jgi:hypothetical protein|nr:hypothetical protein [Gammaproteobacteria bacterium]